MNVSVNVSPLPVLDPVPRAPENKKKWCFVKFWVLAAMI